MISVATDIILLSVAIWAAFALRFENLSWLPGEKQFWASAATVFFTVAAFVKLGLYRAVIRYLSEHAFLAIIVGVILSSVSLIVFGFVFQAFVPRSVPVIYGALAFLLVAGTRFAVRSVVRRPGAKGLEAVVFVGGWVEGVPWACALACVVGW